MQRNNHDVNQNFMLFITLKGYLRKQFFTGAVLLLIIFHCSSILPAPVFAEKLPEHQTTLKAASELDYPPFAIVKSDGTAAGFSVDLLKAATEAVGLTVSFTVGPWNEIKQQLIEKKIDVLPLVSYSKERDKVYDFTAPYLRMNGTVFVRKENTEIQYLSDLQDKELLVMEGDTAHEYVVTKKLSKNIIPTVSYDEAFTLLASGKHDAVVVQQIVGLQMIKKLNIENVAPLEQKAVSSLKPMALKLEGFEQNFCFAVPEGRQEVLSLLNEGLTIIYLDGTYNTLYDKWFGPILPTPIVPLSKLIKQTLFILVPLLLIFTLVGLWYLKRLVNKRTNHLELEIKQRKTIESELAEANAKYVKAQEIGKVGNWEYNIGTEEFLASTEAKRIYGFDKNSETFTSEAVENCIPERERVHQALVDLIEKNVPYNLEFDIITRDTRERRTIMSLAELEKDSVGNPTRIRGVIQDISIRRKVEKALLESEEKLRLLFDNSPVGICTVDLLGNFITTNPAYEKMLGYSKEELKKLSFFDVTHPDYRPKNKELFQNMFSLNSTGFKMEKAYIRKDGGVITVSVNATAVMDDEGNTIFGTAFVDDITEQKQVEESLAESTHLLTEAQRLTSIGSWVQDVPSGRLMWSDETFKIFEIDKNFSGDLFERFLAAVHPEDRKLPTDAYNTALKTKKPYTVSHRLLMPDGRIKHVIECCETTYDDNGNPVKSMGTVQDITERKKAENEQKKLMSQLTQAQKMESVGRLAGGVAHDYNNISSIIIGYSELAMENIEPGDPLHDDLKEILTAAKRSTEITRQLLAFARQQTIAPKILDLNDTIGNMLKMLRRLIGEDIDLAWLPGAELWSIKMDSSQVDQIMANLCVNARDAITDVGKMTVETKNISFDEDYCADHLGFSPGEYVLLAVSDDGCGIAPEILEKIFEPFFTSKGQGEGTGLGLATVYGIVKQNNGFINVYSEQGKGTTIKVYLSRHLGQSDAGSRKEVSEIPLSCGETILLVEDEESILKLGKRILEEQGYTVLAASKPSEAVSLAKEHAGEINLLITDVVMPEMNGRELSELLQKAYLNLKVLFMSGYTANIIAHRGVLDDDVCFLPKPFSKEDMAVNVREVLDGTKDKTHA